MFLELRAKRVDRMSLTPLQYTRQTANNYSGKASTSIAISPFPIPSRYNLKKPMFADKRVRQAIAYAVNKDEIIEGILLAGKGPPAPTSRAWAYNSQVKRYPYDPAKARALCGGWLEGHQGRRILEKNGEPFVFEIITNQGNEVRAKCVGDYQKRLAEWYPGENQNLEWAAFVNDFINSGALMQRSGWTIPMDPDIMMSGIPVSQGRMS